MYLPELKLSHQREETDKEINKPERETDRQTRELFFSFSFLSGQSYSGTSFQVKSAWQSHSIPSRPKSRRSSTLDSIRPKHIFYLFAFLLLYFLLSFQFPTSLTHFFSILLLPFLFSRSTGDNPQIEGIPVYWQKAKS